MPRAEAGFTLLEVVFALAIAVLGIAAVAGATGGAAEVADATRERTLAVWVAGNRLSELRIVRAWPTPGSYDLVRSMGGRTWHLTETVSTTSSEDLRRVDITVYTDAAREIREHRAFGYIARYREAEARVEDPEGFEAENPPVDESGGALPPDEGEGAQ